MFFLAACDSGGGGPKCKFSGETTLADPAAHAWPKFRRDMANTGRIDVDLRTNPGTLRWQYPSDGSVLEKITITPLVGADGEILLVGSVDDPAVPFAQVYVLDARDGSLRASYRSSSRVAPSSTPLLGADGTLFIPYGDGALEQLRTEDDPETIDEDERGTIRNVGSIGGFISGSPNIGDHGTVYIGAASGAGGLSAVCPNGIPRFVAGTGPIESTAAVSRDLATILVGGTNGELRALEPKGRQLWALFTSAGIRNAVVLDEPNQRAFVIDASGRGFSVDVATGARDARFRFHAGRYCSGNHGLSCLSDGDCAPGQSCAGGDVVVSASPALGVNALYVVDEAGVVSAVDPESGARAWVCRAGAAILSSPAVASRSSGAASEDVVVFGANDGALYALDATRAAAQCPCSAGCLETPCACADVSLWPPFALDSSVGAASPAIGFDGTIYIGTQGGLLYAIGAAASATATSAPTATPTPTGTSASVTAR